MRALLVFRSGAQVVVDMDRLSVTKAPADDTRPERISEIRWNNAPGGNRPLAVVASELAAVVELDAHPQPAVEPEATA